MQCTVCTTSVQQVCTYRETEISANIKPGTSGTKETANCQGFDVIKPCRHQGGQSCFKAVKAINLLMSNMYWHYCTLTGIDFHIQLKKWSLNKIKVSRDLAYKHPCACTTMQWWHARKIQIALAGLHWSQLWWAMEVSSIFWALSSPT